ncbi:MAG: hypothetical protein QJR02_07290 [Sinobacteraceae bacterium]|nr:hypothetical protein [Nevskiaceae bacterium]
MRQSRSALLDELGWPSQTAEYRILRGGLGGPAEYTLPEGAVAKLHDIQRGALTIGSLVMVLEREFRAVIVGWYVLDYDVGEIAAYLRKSARSIYAMRRQSLEILWRAMEMLIPLSEKKALDRLQIRG